MIMRIVLFSDVHANLPALEAMLEETRKLSPDMIFCLGDLVGYNVWPNEVIHLIREQRIPCIAGNYDQGIGLGIDECGCAYKTEEDKARGQISIQLTNQWVGAKERAYLRHLPDHISLDFQFTDYKAKLLLVHGSPRKINEYLFEDRDEKSLQRILEESKADILCFGHTHKPWHRKLAYHDGKSGSRHAINTGSVGKPKDSDARGCLVTLDLNLNCSWSDPEAIKVDFIRFHYDVEKAAQAIEKSDLPNEFAEMLRLAK